MVYQVAGRTLTNLEPGSFRNDPMVDAVGRVISVTSNTEVSARDRRMQLPMFAAA